MTLGSQQGVIDLCGSTEAALIDRQLVISRGLVEDRLLEDGLSAPASDNTLSHAVDLMACGLISVSPGKVDPRSQFKVDGFERSDGKESQHDLYFDRAEKEILKYIKRIDGGACVPLGVAVVGRTGRRVGEYEEIE